MLHSVLHLSVPMFALAALTASCGGSASETPWPAAPDPTVFSPLTETSKPARNLDLAEDAGTPQPHLTK